MSRGGDGYSLVVEHQLLTEVASLAVKQSLECGLNSCDTQGHPGHEGSYLLCHVGSS